MTMTAVSMVFVPSVLVSIRATSRMPSAKRFGTSSHITPRFSLIVFPVYIRIILCILFSAFTQLCLEKVKDRRLLKLIGMDEEGWWVNHYKKYSYKERL